MTTTNIQWADRVWNPVVGCSHSGMKGCRLCYAKRLHNQRHKAYLAGKKIPKQYAHPFDDIQLLEDRLDWPLHWRKPARIFVNSMSDLFHEKVPFEFIDQVFARMAICAQHTFIVLTKRVERMKDYILYKFFTDSDIDDVYSIIDDLGGNADVEVPLQNVWLLASASTQEEMEEAAEYLWKIPAAMRGFSFEPLLEMLYDIPPFDWYIIGCESGPKRRPCKNEWIQGIVNFWPRDAGVACFVKQIDGNGKVFKLTEENKAAWPEWAVQQYPEHSGSWSRSKQ